jgi:sporulation protein YlmC with PRC-barrel domain
MNGGRHLMPVESQLGACNSPTNVANWHGLHRSQEPVGEYPTVNPIISSTCGCVYCHGSANQINVVRIAREKALRDEKKTREKQNSKVNKNMKRKIQMIISASAASVLAFSALAQDTPHPKRDRSDDTRQRVAHSPADRLNGAAKASDVIGMTVKNYQDEKLGKVEDLAVDVESGRIVQVILSTGGFIGIGDTLTAVPPGALHHDVAHKVLHLDADKEKLKDAPKFEMLKWAECCDSNHLSEVYRHYGEEAAFRFIDRDDADRDAKRNTTGSFDTASTREGHGTGVKDRISKESQFMIPVSRLSQVQKASALIGTSVKNPQNEKVGKVENILLDLPSGRLVAVIISSGGFLGIGDELSAVPPPALRFATDRTSLQLDASREMLSNAPHFKANQWPDFAQPSYAGKVYRAYSVEPYFSGDAPADPDNTRRNVRDRDDRSRGITEPDNSARNVRDRNDSTLTPLDQGNSKDDVATTAQIRKEIVAEKNLSVNARNVKIMTNKGRVTLRGPVKTAEEKHLIGQIANRIARPENVDNQLEVSLTPAGRN